MDDFEKAVAGWRQCSNILADTTAKLEWVLLQIKLAPPGSLPENTDNAKKFYEAEQSLRTAKAYCAAQSRALGQAAPEQ
jgi:hypothetical protein